MLAAPSTRENSLRLMRSQCAKERVMSVRETFAAELEALVDKYGHSLNDNEVITTLEEALSRAWGFACEPRPASLFAAAPALLEALQTAAARLEDISQAFDLTCAAVAAREAHAVVAEVEDR